MNLVHPSTPQEIVTTVYCLGFLIYLGYYVGATDSDKKFKKYDLDVRIASCVVIALLWPACMVGRMLWDGEDEDDGNAQPPQSS